MATQPHTHVISTGKKISDFSVASHLQGDEKIPMGVAGDFATTPNQLKSYIGGGSSTGTTTGGSGNSVILHYGTAIDATSFTHDLFGEFIHDNLTGNTSKVINEPLLSTDYTSLKFDGNGGFTGKADGLQFSGCIDFEMTMSFIIDGFNNYEGCITVPTYTDNVGTMIPLVTGINHANPKRIELRYLSDSWKTCVLEENAVASIKYDLRITQTFGVVRVYLNGNLKLTINPTDNEMWYKRFSSRGYSIGCSKNQLKYAFTGRLGPITFTKI